MLMIKLLILSERCPTLVSHSVYLNNLANIDSEKHEIKLYLYVRKISEFIKSQIAFDNAKKKSVYPSRCNLHCI